MGGRLFNSAAARSYALGYDDDDIVGGKNNDVEIARNQQTSPGNIQVALAKYDAARSRVDGQVLGLLEESLRQKAESLSNFSTISSQQSRALSKIFKRYDQDNSGMLSRAEFQAALTNMHFGRQDADILFDAYDINDN